jgi:uncharacterized SAM-binding protein YcdF (DUF218 family)
VKTKDFAKPFFELYQRLPGRKIILSGGSLYQPISEAETMARVVKELGVAPQDILLESASADTEDQARLVKAPTESIRQSCESTKTKVA